MEADAANRHRWSMALYPLDGGPTAEPQANYGSRIGRGETQRIDAAPHASNRRCEILSTHETSQGWEPDVAEVVVDSPDDLAIQFHGPSLTDAVAAPQPCVIALQFSPALRPS